MVIKSSISSTAQSILQYENLWRITPSSIDNALKYINNSYIDLICLEVDTITKQIIDLLKIVKNKRLKTKIIAVIPANYSLKHILLTYGCDDYICKPYEKEDLILRCKKLIHCIPIQYEIVYECNSLRYEQKLHRVMYNNTYIPLTPTEINVVKLLIKRGFASTNEIIDYIESKHGKRMTKEYVALIMYRIKDKMRLCVGMELIENIYGKGYKIIH